MDTDYMRQFLVLAETLSYAEAAHRLYISQPTLSRHVMQLEEQIDARLLERSTRSVELTPIGKEAVRQFRRAVGAEDKLLAAAQGEKRRLAGHVRVGFMYHCSECLSRLLLAFESKYPDVHVSLSSSKPEELYGRFEARQLDIVQVMDGAMGGGGWQEAGRLPVLPPHGAHAGRQPPGRLRQPARRRPDGGAQHPPW